MGGARLLALEMQPPETFNAENFKPHSLLIIDSNYNYN
jgi:hypothetical protein